MRTPPRPAELLDTFPELAGHARTATRLHPRPGATGAAGSHIGGPLRWPVGEPWPVCDQDVTVDEDVPLPVDLVTRLREAEQRRVQRHVLADGEAELHQEVAALVGPGFTGWGSTGGGPVVGHRSAEGPHLRPSPLVAVAQLRAADIPDLPRPDGADLLQVLWCPFQHPDHSDGPAVTLRWRREADVAEPFLDPPAPAEDADEDLVPVPCRLHPEQVVEYPYHEELPPRLQERLRAWDGRGEQYLPGRYLDQAMAPGWKVGGYASWNVTDLLDTPCPRCAGPAPLLFVAASGEYDGDDREWWKPLEDPDPDEADEPTGVVVGRAGSLRLFACLTCSGTPFTVDIQ